MLAFLISLAAAVKILATILGSAVFWKFVVTPVKKGLQRLESIGDNGDETIFQMLHQLRRQQAILGSLQDIIDTPMFIADSRGHIISANIACSRLLGWNVEELRFGGWRSKLDREAQVLWDEAIEQKAIFERSVMLADFRGVLIPVRLLVKPIWDLKDHLGWRGVIETAEPYAK